VVRSVIKILAPLIGPPLLEVTVPLIVPVSVSSSCARQLDTTLHASKRTTSVRSKNCPPWVIVCDTIFIRELSDSPGF
jgi:hypothetical protein